MFEVLWKGVKGFFTLVGVFFSFMQGGADIVKKPEAEE